MKQIIPLDQIHDEDRTRVGGKGFALAVLARSGMEVPEAVCICSDVYDSYVSSTGLRERILLELNRKSFNEMRWEEMWDASLRIRNMFLRTPIPGELRTILEDLIEPRFRDKAVVVRSSAPGEDSWKTSFAGLHESYVNIRDVDSIVAHVRLVWASLWSDRALLYRQELGLDVEMSSMAVVVQELVVGERSGVAFGVSPIDESQAVIEAVYGLNQGLVDGTVEPDRWILDRSTGNILSHSPAQRQMSVVPTPEGVRLEPLPPSKLEIPPIDDEETNRVFDLALKAERHFGGPQDVEWTFKKDVLYTLQSRPITTAATGESDDKRPWYLSLHRSFENLKTLRERIESELIPEMLKEVALLASQNPEKLSDSELAREIAKRASIHQKWVDTYWNDFIPFAHGARLFGQVYNDTLCPSDPYEFMDLLRDTEMASLERNRMLEHMAARIRTDPLLADSLRNKRDADLNEEFSKALEMFTDRFGDLPATKAQPAKGREAVIRLLLEMADCEPLEKRLQFTDIKRLTEEFLSKFQGEQRAFAAELLDLGRASYRLRDDDNIYLGKIESQMVKALEEGKRRIERRTGIQARHMDSEEVVRALKDPKYVPTEAKLAEKGEVDFALRARQLTGQPAGPGIAKGKARVIESASELFDFKAGEILVCDAVDPNMTFVVPLSAGIVERRGGMLIHGAIIAREYGLPCVTGIPDATSLIRTGDQLTVDGYLGIVIINRTVSPTAS